MVLFVALHPQWSHWKEIHLPSPIALNQIYIICIGYKKLTLLVNNALVKCYPENVLVFQILKFNQNRTRRWELWVPVSDVLIDP